MRTVRYVYLCLPLLLFPNLTAAQLPTGQSRICALFTVAEITELLGTPVETGDPLTTGSGCHWFGVDEESYTIVQVEDSTFWIDPQGAPGYEAVDGAWTRAYVHPDMEGGWRSMALVGDRIVAVVMIGRSARRENTVSLLRQVVERL